MEFPQPFLVYKSSAGSGKTFNLAKIYLRLILEANDPYYFRRILAITFTVKAAGEMKDRIISYLSILGGNSQRKRSDASYMLAELIEATQLSEADIKKRSQKCLSSILHNYGEFQVVTIDKFFASLIRSFAAELSLNPDYEITVDRSLIIDRAKDVLFDNIGVNPSLTKVVLSMLDRRLQEDRSNNADDVIDKACKNLLSDEFFFVEEHFKDWSVDDVFTLNERLSLQIAELTRLIATPALNAMNLIQAHGLSAEDFHRKKSGIYGYFNRIAHEDFSKMDPNTYVMATIQEDKWMGGSKNSGVTIIQDQLGQHFEEIQQLRKEYQKLKLLEAIQNEVFSLGFYGELRRILEVIQQEDNVQLLSQFNTLIASQLENEQTYFLFERLGIQFQHILIDEFQDTSVLQWKNLLPLVENSLAEGHTSLVVGDAKQSIYRWRNSDPEQFIRLPEVPSDAKDLFRSAYEEVVLDRNFRSGTNIISFNNRFFELASKQVLESDFRRTYEAHAQKPVSDHAGKVRWWISEKDKRTKEELMMQMLNRLNYIVSKEQVNEGDICCLFRTNADAASMASLLIQSGFKVVSQESLLVQNNPSVQLLVATLQLLQKDQDPFAVQQWMSRLHHVHPIDGYHLLAKKAKDEKWGLKRAFAALQLDAMQADLRHGDAYMRSMAICRQLDLDTTNPFVTKFLDLALQFEQTGGYLKESFIEVWESKKEDLSIQLGSASDAISIMTIHRSKGLEFPSVMVFLPEIKKRNTKEYAWVDPQTESDLGRLHLKLSSLKETALSELYIDEEARSHLDMLNVLYVAFTRAESRLEVFSGAPSKDSLLNLVIEWDEWNQANCVLEIG